MTFIYNIQNSLKKKYIKIKRKFRRDKKRNINKTKALLIGINYRGTGAELKGCINDVIKMEKLLRSRGCEEFMILTEDTLMPTRENILKGIEWLCNDSEKYNRVMLHYSGHGSWLRDISGDEKDGHEECLVPIDYRENGMIIDDELHEIFVKKIKTDAFVLIDACHSGSMLDLENCYTSVPKHLSGLKYNTNNWTNDYVITKQTTKENTKHEIMMISGCRDDQTSVDAYIENISQGALTYTFVETVKYSNSISIEELIKQIHVKLILKNYEQRIVLSCNKLINMQNIFCLL